MHNRFTKKQKKMLWKKILNHKRKGTKKKYKTNKKIRFKISVNTYPSIAALNVSGLNALIKRQRVGEWMRKQEPMHWECRVLTTGPTGKSQSSIFSRPHR